MPGWDGRYAVSTGCSPALAVEGPALRGPFISVPRVVTQCPVPRCLLSVQPDDKTAAEAAASLSPGTGPASHPHPTASPPLFNLTALTTPCAEGLGDE